MNFHAVPQTLWAPFVFLVGLCVGSFLNVCAFRWLQENLSIVRPRSFCPSCRETIVWYDNIPVLSYLLLKGRCRKCGWKISIHYPIVELVTGLAFLMFFLADGFSAKFFFETFFVGMLLVGTIADFQVRLIPDEVSFYGILFGLLMSYAFPSLQGETNHRLAVANSILGVLLGGGSLYVIAVVGDIIFKRESMGGGDIKLLAMIGAFLGPRYIVLTIIASSLFGSVVGIILKLTRKEEVIAFGPYLAGGAVVSFLWGERLMGIFFPMF